MPSDKLKISQTPLFGRKIKKLKRNEKEALDGEVRRLLSEPELGEEKKGDLQGIRVHKYKFNRKEILLAYFVSEKEIVLITIGSHENYYRNLKAYRK